MEGSCVEQEVLVDVAVQMSGGRWKWVERTKTKVASEYRAIKK